MKTKRIGVDEYTKARLHDTSKRKGIKIAKIVRMAWTYWHRIKGSDEMPSLTYERGKVTDVIEVARYNGGEECDCAVINLFLDDKDDGKTNGSAHRGTTSEDGTETMSVATLGMTVSTEVGVCGVYQKVLGEWSYTFCEPASPFGVGDFGFSRITCPACINILEAARKFPLMQTAAILPDNNEGDA